MATSRYPAHGIKGYMDIGLAVLDARWYKSPNQRFEEDVYLKGYCPVLTYERLEKMFGFDYDHQAMSELANTRLSPEERKIIQALTHPAGEEYPGAFDTYKLALENEYGWSQEKIKRIFG